MEKAVGETVTLVRTNPATGAETRERARILAANGGVVMQIGDRIEVLRDDGLPVRVIFDRVPDNLRARPTLSVTVRARAAGAGPVTLTYLTRGLGWSADYVALFDEANGRMDVQGWITLTNNSGTPYVNANTLLVAGAVGATDRSGNDYPAAAAARRPIRSRARRPRARERLGDFYLYPLPERTTIADTPDQAGQLPRRRTTRRRRAPMNIAMPGSATAEQPRAPTRVLRFSTARGQGLGDALPAGTVRVYQRDARGNPQFVGEHAIGHTPMGSELGLATGQAFDVKVRPVVERARADQRRALAHDDALHADQCPAEAGHRRSAPAGPVGRHPDHRGKPCRVERRSTPTRLAGASRSRPTAKPPSPRPSTRASERPRCALARAPSLCSALAAGPAAAQAVVTSARAASMSRSPFTAPRRAPIEAFNSLAERLCAWSARRGT